MAISIGQYLPAQSAAGGTVTVPIGIVSTVEGTDNWIRTIRFVSSSTLTGVTTNTVTFNVRVIRSGAAAFTIGSLAMISGTNLTAETPVTLTVSATQAQITSIVEGDVIDVQMVQGGTGLAVNANQVMVQADIS